MTLFLEHQEGGYYPTINGDTMAMIRTSEHREGHQGPIEIYRKGQYFHIGNEPIEISTGLAINLIADPALHVEFTASDRKDIENANAYLLDILTKHFQLSDKEEVLNHLYPSKIKLPKLPKKKEVKVEPVEEEVAESPLPPNLDKMTNKELGALLEERGLSPKGKKADLIERLIESDSKKGLKTTSKVE